MESIGLTSRSNYFLLQVFIEFFWPVPDPFTGHVRCYQDTYGAVRTRTVLSAETKPLRFAIRSKTGKCAVPRGAECSFSQLQQQGSCLNNYPASVLVKSRVCRFCGVSVSHIHTFTLLVVNSRAEYVSGIHHSMKVSPPFICCKLFEIWCDCRRRFKRITDSNRLRSYGSVTKAWQQSPCSAI